jgi:hypothetical protein
LGVTSSILAWSEMTSFQHPGIPAKFVGYPTGTPQAGGSSLGPSIRCAT